MIEAFDRGLCAVNRRLVIVLLAAMATMVFANVVLRYTTGYSILWSEEASRYAMVWLTFVGAGLVLRYGGHIGIDTLQEKLPRHAPLIRGVIFAALLAFFVVLAVVGTRYAILTWGQTTPVLRVPIGAIYLAMPVGAALLVAHLLLMAQSWVVRGESLAGGEFDADAARM